MKTIWSRIYLLLPPLAWCPGLVLLLPVVVLSTDAAPVVTGDRTGLNGTTHAMAFDGSLTTSFRSSYDDWQYLQVDFGVAGRFSGLRRYMTSNGTSIAGQRTTQGEGAQYSLDGANWFELTAHNTRGWEDYFNYGARQHAWRNLAYGWSAWLDVTNPVSARYVRFNWDGANDALNEVEIGFFSPALHSTNVVTAVADAQTVSGLPGANYGSQATFSTIASAGAEAMRSHLRFDLSSIPRDSAIQSAQLELFAADVGGTGVRRAQVFSVNAPWVENSIRWSNQPPVRTAGAIRTVTLNQWNTWDLTAFVNDWISGSMPNYGIALRPVLVAGEGFSTVFRSREAATNWPRLVVTYGPPPSPQNAAFVRLRQESATLPIGYFNGGLPTTVQMQWPIPATAPADPLLCALDFLDRFRAVYQLANPRAQLVPLRRTTSASGRHLIFEQIHEGMPVIGSQLAVHLNGTHVMSTGGRWLSELPLLPPAALTAAQAESRAKSWCEEQGAPDPGIVGQSRLVWFNPSLSGGGPNQTWLAWRVSVSGRRDGAGSAWSALIDAHTGERRWLLQQQQPHELPDKDFTVFTANGNTNLDCDVTLNADEWFDTEGPDGYPGFASDSLLEGTNAWRFLHTTYDYFYNTFGRRSWNDYDMPVEVFTHAGFNNAFYSLDCSILAFGNSNVLNDVFAHEFTHGIIHFTADLQYQDQQGALNESIADVFGAMVDTGDWLQGEDDGTASRSLANPPLFGDPDHMLPARSGDTNGLRPMPPTNVRNAANDWGGVHINSGIPNKAAFLLGNGGTHNGFGIRQLGRAKVQRLWYDVLITRLGPSSQFNDFRNEAVNLAREYWRQGLYDFSSTDICDVINAFASVGLGAGDLDCDGFDDLNDEDTDGDGIPNAIDNCDTVMNWPQFDRDGDGQGDECDADDDGDGVADMNDNAPNTFNPDQADRDGDGRGDVIDDSDLDGILDIHDNCPLMQNRNQLDSDADGMGDACDSDDDNDGVPDVDDNCRFIANGSQKDIDGDGRGDACDNCVNTPNPDQAAHDDDGAGDACDNDDDNDRVPDALDNCPTSFNPDQEDLDRNGIGYACDPNEQLTYPRFGAQRLRAEIEFLNDARVLRFPLDFCVTPLCGEPLPEDFLAETRLSLPAGIRARIVDDRGFVVAKGRGKEQVLRFPPRTDWAYTPPDREPPAAFVAAVGAAEPEPYRGASYTLELERDSEVPTDVRLPVTIDVGTILSSAARLELRVENNRPVVTIIGARFRQYRLESSSNLLTWTPVLTASSPDGRIVHASQQVVSGRRFYRAMLLP